MKGDQGWIEQNEQSEKDSDYNINKMEKVIMRKLGYHRESGRSFGEDHESCATLNFEDYFGKI
eukprot:CAMPEP_0170524628 /NCGR_PEP_ID=MMETSP0209-20121228/10116_1 /TAXON_ID=665100 ORGANISM="Litonotus pictus, Strain P1" /NCGR_SAMPLE_ID=MMETSP0209 /ASSEMBLY_ACC=CAM_ASM_000301 /LENGTH=62 /DNA_ID=CAMNT_0010813449 /DNA_START=215 /DNA_END=403 /DNA_ORIENTATION=-